MSILDRGPHTLTVYPVVQVDDGYGGTMPGPGDPITVRAYCSPIGERDESGAVVGYPAELEFQVTARSLPAGAWAHVEWEGVRYVVVAEPRRFGFSRRTAHDVAIIRKG